jgi:hypothetical protein
MQGVPFFYGTNPCASSLVSKGLFCEKSALRTLVLTFALAEREDFELYYNRLVINLSKCRKSLCHRIYPSGFAVFCSAFHYDNKDIKQFLFGQYIPDIYPTRFRLSYYLLYSGRCLFLLSKISSGIAPNKFVGRIDILSSYCYCTTDARNKRLNISPHHDILLTLP